MNNTPQFDVVGVGLNATDTLLIVPSFPAYAGKARIAEEILSTGGQVASAIVTCAALGLRTTYIGTVGDDERGRIQLESLRTAGVSPYVINLEFLLRQDMPALAGVQEEVRRIMLKQP